MHIVICKLDGTFPLIITKVNGQFSIGRILNVSSGFWFEMFNQNEHFSF